MQLEVAKIQTNRWENQILKNLPGLKFEISEEEGVVQVDGIDAFL